MEDSAIDEEFLPAEVVNTFLGDYNATTTLIDTIFIPSKRIPKDLLDQFTSNPEKLNEQLLANLPLLKSQVAQPYWSKGKNPRQFDSISIQVFGAVCLTEDRHCLESIVASSAMYKDLSTKTLRQALKASNINFDLEFMNDQHRSQLDINLFTSLYDYYLVDFGTLCPVLGIGNVKANKIKIMERLRRLSIMELVIQPEKDNVPISKLRRKFNLVDNRAIIPLLCLDSVKAKSQVTSETFTHVIVGVDRNFTKTLENEGAISRNRFLDVYPGLNGKNQVTDFMKYLDTHEIKFLHGKYLKTLVEAYLERKARITQKYPTTQVNATIAEVVTMREVLLTKFGLLLVEQDRSGIKEWQLISVNIEQMKLI
jgi:hypothetical protein